MGIKKESNIELAPDCHSFVILKDKSIACGNLGKGVSISISNPVNGYLIKKLKDDTY